MDIIGKIRDNMSGPNSSVLNSNIELSILRKKWIGLVLLQIVLLAAGSLLLIAWWGNQAAFRWLGLGALFSLGYFGALWRRLELNHFPAEANILPNSVLFR